jgi:hypothetical protein
MVTTAIISLFLLDDLIWKSVNVFSTVVRIDAVLNIDDIATFTKLGMLARFHQFERAYFLGISTVYTVKIGL